MRVFNHIRNERPSTSKLIDLRLQTRLSYTESQIKFYKTKTVYTDLLFLYLEKAFLSQISLIFNDAFTIRRYFEFYVSISA